MISSSLEQIVIADLQPYARNAWTHSKKQVREIATSIQRFGFTNPILIDRDNQILAGHGRVQAARLLSMTTVPCVRIEHMSAAEKRAYVIADNKLALNAGWDTELLAEELKELFSSDLDITGFSIAEIDKLIGGVDVAEPRIPAEDRLPPVDPAQTRCRPGDIWQLGNHRLICGNPLDTSTVARLMDGERADMVFTTPCFDGFIDGDGDLLGAIHRLRSASAPGEMAVASFTALLRSAMTNLTTHSVDGSVHFICMDWRRMTETTEAGNAVYRGLESLIVWAKDKGDTSTLYHSQHELVFAFRNGAGPHIDGVGLRLNGRQRSNIWQYREAGPVQPGRANEPAPNPAVKPVAMISDAIKDVSQRGGIILDLFGGSGSTLIAAHKTGRKARICELDPIGCDQIIRRWEIFSKDRAECFAHGISEATTPDVSGTNGARANIQIAEA